MHLLPKIEERLQAEYSEELEYHAWSHAVQVDDKSIENRSILITEGLTDVDGLFTTSVRALGHDAGMLEFFKRNLAEKYSYPEFYSMVLTARILKDLRVDPTTIDEAVQPIMGTKCGEKCRDLASYVLCVSDVDNSEHELTDYDTLFSPATARLRREHVLLKGVDLGREGYDDFSLGLLAKYCMINLNQPHILERSPYLRTLRARQLTTLGHLAAQRATESGLSVVEYASRLGEPVPQMLAAA